VLTNSYTDITEDITNYT